MGFFISLITNKYVIVGVIFAAIVGGSVYYISNLKDQVTTLTAQDKVLTSDLSVSNASIKTLQSALDTQNAAVNTLKSAADAQVKANAVIITDATKKADNYKAQSAALLAKKLPQDANTCSAANDLINSEIQNAK